MKNFNWSRKPFAILLMVCTLPFLMAPSAPVSRNPSAHTLPSQGISKLKAEKKKTIDDLEAMSLSDNIDSDFVNLVIRYHQAVLEVSKLELEFGQNEDVKKAAQGELNEEETKVTLLKEFLNKR